MENKVLKCKVCGGAFEWSIEEQQFYADRQLSEPKRCQNCRAKRKTDRDTIVRLENRIKELEQIIGGN